jgi:hypothetical protein
MVFFFGMSLSYFINGNGYGFSLFWGKALSAFEMADQKHLMLNWLVSSERLCQCMLYGLWFPQVSNHASQ